MCGSEEGGTGSSGNSALPCRSHRQAGGRGQPWEACDCGRWHLCQPQPSAAPGGDSMPPRGALVLRVGRRAGSSHPSVRERAHSCGCTRWRCPPTPLEGVCLQHRLGCSHNFFINECDDSMKGFVQAEVSLLVWIFQTKAHGEATL